MVRLFRPGACLFVLSFIGLVLSAQIPLFPESHSEGYKFKPLLHLPGISPYFDAIGSGLNHRAPRNCEVTAASYLIRHAAIYANDDDYEYATFLFVLRLELLTLVVRRMLDP
jgi:hypothetical protein